MSTIQDIPIQALPGPASAEDPFRYGWRYVKRIAPDGTEDYEQVPLTEEDLLFPEEGDFAVQTDMHVEDFTHLRMVFKTKLAGEPEAVVLADCRVDFNVPGLRPLGPDVIVLFGLKGPRKNWATFHVGVERARPVLVIEVTSDDTRKNDLGIKIDYYHKARVPLYVVVDAHDVGGKRRLELIGFRWTPERYERIPLNEHGRLWLDPVGLWLGIAPIEEGYGQRAACFDPVTGKQIGDYTKLSESLQQAESRAEEAESREEAVRRTRISNASRTRGAAEGHGRGEPSTAGRFRGIIAPATGIGRGDASDKRLRGPVLKLTSPTLTHTLVTAKSPVNADSKSADTWGH